MFRNAICAATSSAPKRLSIDAGAPCDKRRRELLQPFEALRTSFVPGESGTSISRRMRSSPSTLLRPDEIEPPENCQAGRWCGAEKVRRVQLPGIERQLEAQLHGGHSVVP